MPATPRLLLLLTTFCLHSHSDAQIATVIQKGHDAVVKSVTFSTDDQYLITGSRDKSAKLWEIATGREVRTYLGHEHTINDLDMGPKSKTFATSSADNTAKVWDIESGELTFTTPKMEKYMTAVAFSPDGKWLATGGYMGEVLIWDLKTQQATDTLKVNPEQGLGYGINLTFSPNGQFLAIGEDNRVANIYRTSDWSLEHAFTLDYGWCGGCATFTSFSPDGQWLAKQSHNDTLKIYNLATGALEKKLGTAVEEVIGVQFHPSGQMVIIGTTSAITGWDLTTNQQAFSMSFEEESAVNDFAMSLNGQWLATAQNDNITVLWDLETRQPIREFRGILNSKEADGLTYDPNNYWQSHIAKYIKYKNELLVMPDQQKLIKGKFGTMAKSWKIADGQTVTEYIGHDKAVLTQALTKDGQWLATGGGDGRLMVWDAQSGALRLNIEAHRQPIFEVKWSNDESMLVTGSWDGTAKVWDSQTGQRLQYLDFNNQSPYAISFTPDDLYLVAGLLDQSLQMFEIDTRQSVRQFIGHTDIVSTISFLPGGDMMSTSWDGSTRIWNLASGLMVRKLKGHVGPVYDAVATSDGQWVVTGGADRVLRVWDASSGRQVRTLQGHQADVTAMAFNEGDKMLISTGLDGVTKFWDFEKGEEFFEHIHIGSRDWMVKTKEGYFNATTQARAHIHFVDGIKTYAVDQFFEEFYRPDLVPLLFKSRGGAGKYQGLNRQLRNSPPPLIKMGAFQTTEEGFAQLFFRVIDQGGGFEDIKVLHNGKRIENQELEKISTRGDTSQYRMKVGLIAGENDFVVTSFSKGRVESAPDQITMQSEFGGKSAQCYVLAVGVDEYRNPQLNLNYARSDASAMVDMFTNQSERIFEEVHVLTLYDNEATRARILSELSRLADLVNPEDVFVFYFAGHGSMVENEFFFIPSDNARLYEKKALEKYALPAAEVQTQLQEIKALKQLVIMDACQSGGSVELLAQRGAVEEKAIAQLSRSAGIHVMAAAGSEQFATEFADLGHGLFTYVLLEALGGAADGAPKDNKVTIYELKSYLDDRVPTYSREYKGKSQFPYTFSKGRDFPITIVK
ncbi:MAG: caspase family protein [Bacteroidota bacterium]